VAPPATNPRRRISSDGGGGGNHSPRVIVGIRSSGGGGVAIDGGATSGGGGSGTHHPLNRRPPLRPRGATGPSSSAPPAHASLPRLLRMLPPTLAAGAFCIAAAVALVLAALGRGFAATHWSSLSSSPSSSSSSSLASTFGAYLSLGKDAAASLSSASSASSLSSFDGAGPAAIITEDMLPAAPEACSPALRRRVAFGVASGSYQVEGAWRDEGKGLSIWDAFVGHEGRAQEQDGEAGADGGGSDPSAAPSSSTTPTTPTPPSNPPIILPPPPRIPESATGDVAADHYRRWREDIALLSRLGVRHYRMAVSWPRVLPSGGRGSPINQAALSHYKQIVAELARVRIQPLITLYHWDLPQALQDDYGGFLDPQFADDFVHYADVVFGALHPLGAKHWITFSEPMSICQLGYGIGAAAPGVAKGSAGQYLCGHHLLIAHARAAQLFRQRYGGAWRQAAAAGGEGGPGSGSGSSSGRIGLAISGHWPLPRDLESLADMAASRHYLEHTVGWMADPLYTGDYPRSMRKSQGGLLPNFSASDARLLKGSADFFALTYYTSHFVGAPPAGAPRTQLYEEHLKDSRGRVPGAPSASAWLFSAPYGLRAMLAWVSRRYGSPEVWVVESGYCEPGEAEKPAHEALADAKRLGYHRAHLEAACEAAAEDGARLGAYFAWSFLDGFEGQEGYVPRFGLVRVDRQTMERTPKLSAHWMARHFWGDNGRQPTATTGDEGGGFGGGGGDAAAAPGGGGASRLRWGSGGKAAAAMAAVDWMAALEEDDEQAKGGGGGGGGRWLGRRRRRLLWRRWRRRRG
jgi:beta-glucosidase